MYARMRPVRPSASWTVATPRWANGANRSIAERSTFRTTMPLITCRTFHAVRRPSSGGPDVLRVVVDVGMAGRCEQFRLFRLEIEQPLNAAHDGVVDFALAVEADQRRSLGVEQVRLELAQARPDACGIAVLLRAVHTELRPANGADPPPPRGQSRQHRHAPRSAATRSPSGRDGTARIDRPFRHRRQPVERPDLPRRDAARRETSGTL